MQIPFLDLKAINLRDDAAFKAAVSDVLASGHYIMGKHLEDFEAEFARYSNTKHCIGVGNGLDALVLILRAAGVGAGDEVIVPANTFIASFLAISAVGAVPVPVDVDPDTLLVGPEQIAPAIGAKTKAIMPVHLFGHACDLPGIVALAKEHNLIVVEDAAQAQGAKDAKGNVVGSMGIAAGVSFYPGKNLGALGDGGAILTQDDAFAEKLRHMRNYGARVKYVHDDLGMNSRLDEMQAALLSIRLARLEDDNIARRGVAKAYLEGIRNPNVRLPQTIENSQSVWHLFVVRTKNRQGFMDYLASKSIQTLIHYPIACHKQECYSELAHVSCPVSEQAADEIVSLPVSPIMTAEQVNYVVDAINDWQG